MRRSNRDKRINLWLRPWGREGQYQFQYRKDKHDIYVFIRHPPSEKFPIAHRLTDADEVEKLLAMVQMGADVIAINTFLRPLVPTWSVSRTREKFWAAVRRRTDPAYLDKFRGTLEEALRLHSEHV